LNDACRLIARTKLLAVIFKANRAITSLHSDIEYLASTEPVVVLRDVVVAACRTGITVGVVIRCCCRGGDICDAIFVVISFSAKSCGAG